MRNKKKSFNYAVLSFLSYFIFNGNLPTKTTPKFKKDLNDILQVWLLVGKQCLLAAGGHAGTKCMEMRHIDHPHFSRQPGITEILLIILEAVISASRVGNL